MKYDIATFNTFEEARDFGATIKGYPSHRVVELERKFVVESSPAGRIFGPDGHTTHVRKCPKCALQAHFLNHCGAYVCATCNNHIGLVRCYCGWSLSGRDGRRELEEMGENIDDE